MRAGGKSIRINLRFGKRTAPDLITELSARNPYARAKFIRALALDGLRLRRGEMAVVAQEGSADDSPSVFSDSQQHTGDDDALSLFGSGVHL